MKKNILIAVVVILLLGGAYVWNKNENIGSQFSDDKSKSSPTTVPNPSVSMSATYKDGSYTSDVVQTDRGYGPVQVKLVIAGGKITDVVFVQFPNTPGHTTEVSSVALPILKQEALAKQSSAVDIVSGATQTTEAFQTAMSSALSLAK